MRGFQCPGVGGVIDCVIDEHDFDSLEYNSATISQHFALYLSVHLDLPLHSLPSHLVLHPAFVHHKCVAQRHNVAV